MTPELEAVWQELLERATRPPFAERARLLREAFAARCGRLEPDHPAAALRDAVVRGTPFQVELEEARYLGADEKYVAPLAPFAAHGVPAAATLAQELYALIPALVKASGAQAPSGNFFDRLQANASKLVRIRPVDAPAGDGFSTVLARIEVEAAHADIDGALSDLEKLDAATRALARDWIAKAQSRQTAIAAARQLSADTMQALGKR